MKELAAQHDGERRPFGQRTVSRGDEGVG